MHCNKFSQLYKVGGGAARKKFMNKVDSSQVRLTRKKKVHCQNFYSSRFLESI